MHLSLAAFFTLLLCASAQANVGEAYGFGSRAAALGGAGVAYGFGGHAAYSNLAGLPFDGEKRLKLEYGILSMTPNFTSIQNVVVENAYVSDKVTVGDVDTSYRSTLGQEIGVAFRLLPEAFNLTAGIALFLPLSQVAYLDTGEAFAPEYLLYRSRTQRPQVEFGMGADLGRGFRVGLGLHLAFSLTSSATVFLQADSNKPSSMRFNSSLKPKVSPVLGLHFAPPSDPEAYAVGLVVRFPVASPNTLFLKSGARAFGSLFPALDFNFNSVSSLLYDPLTIELGTSIRETSSGSRLYAQLDYQAWSKFEPPVLMIENPSVTSCGSSPCGIKISPGKNPPFGYQDIFIPRIGQEWVFGTTSVRLGYSYRPSILTGLPTEAGNYLDPPRHNLTAGVGWVFSHFLSYNSPCTLDLHLAYSQLVTQHITKSPGDEAGTGTGNLKIGAPGYDAGGNIYGGGLSLSLAI